MALMGIDIGTTGSKCTIFDCEGKILSYAYCEYSIENPMAGIYELNPNIVWNCVKEILYASMKKLQSDTVTALSVSSIGEAVVPLNKDGRVLCNSILYTDNRGFHQAKYLGEKVGRERIMQLTGLPLSGIYSINKIMWMKENMSEIFGQVEKFLLFEDFIIYMLTGEMLIDYSLASRTMAFNVIKKEWEPEILEAAGIKEGFFAKAVQSGSVVGFIKKNIAEETGLSLKTLVVTGGHDQACAALGAGIIKGEMAVDGMGTGECITTAYDKPVLNNYMLNNNFNCGPHVIEGLYLSLSFTVCAGGLLKWFRDSFCRHEAIESEKLGVNIYKFLDERAVRDPTSILVLPHFSGSGTPYLDHHSKGAILGLTLGTKSSHIYRALMEGISYEMRYNLDCLKKAGVNINRIRAVGGGSKSELWLQIKADILGLDIETLKVSEAGTLGTVIIAGVATGVYKNFEAAVKLLVEPKKVFSQNLKNKAKYDENYESYKKVYESVKKIYQN